MASDSHPPHKDIHPPQSKTLRGKGKKRQKNFAPQPGILPFCREKRAIYGKKEFSLVTEFLHLLNMRIPIPVIATAFVLALPILIPFTLARQWLVQRRLRSAATCQPCPTCGNLIGSEALRNADECWRKHVAELHGANPGVRFRLIRLVHAICAVCGSRLKFREDSRTFAQTGVTEIIPGAIAMTSKDIGRTMSKE